MPDDDVSIEALARAIRKARREWEDKAEELEGLLAKLGGKKPDAPAVKPGDPPAPEPKGPDGDDDGGIGTIFD